VSFQAISLFTNTSFDVIINTVKRAKTKEDTTMTKAQEKMVNRIRKDAETMHSNGGMRSSSGKSRTTTGAP